MEIETKTCTCCSCGISFTVPSSYYAKLQENHNTFYCPNGHSLHFPSKSQAEIWQERCNKALADRDKIAAEREQLAGEILTLRKRKKKAGAP